MGAWDKLEQAADKIKDKVDGRSDDDTAATGESTTSEPSSGGPFGKVEDAIRDAAERETEQGTSTGESAEGGVFGKVQEAIQDAADDAKAQEAEEAAAAKAAKDKAEKKKAEQAKKREYVVKPGDNLSTIALKHGHGISYMELAKYNGIKNPDLIHPGQVIKFPN